ncbi:MAG: class I SAM-dependent methyltransferase [Acidobacteriota bacterium]
MSSVLDVAKTVGFPALIRMRRVKREVWEELISPHFVTRSIQTLLNVGFLDALRQGPLDPAEFARDHALNERLLLALSEALYARRVLTRKGSRFGLDEKGKLIVQSSLGRGWFDLVFGYEAMLHGMEDMLRNKTSYGGRNVRDGRFVGVGSGLASVDFYFPLVRRLIAGGGCRRVLDIGCGDGMFLRYLCASLPGVEGVGLDLSPEAVAAGNQSIRQEGLGDRIRLHVGDANCIGDFRNELKGVDAATTFFVLHELCDNKDNARVKRFLSAYRDTLAGVPFHIVESVRPPARELRKRPGPAVEYFLFHDLSGQTPIARDAWKALFRSAHFSSVKEDFLGFVRTSIYTLR